MGEPSSLSSDAKDVLARDVPAAAHCRAALRAGLLLYGVMPGSGTFRTRRAAVARLLWSLLADRKDRAIRRPPGSRQRRAPSFAIAVPEEGLPRRPAARCDRRTELRAAFLACGSLSSPARGYHLEFVPVSEVAAARLNALLRAEELEPKRGARRGRPLLYFKDVEAISRFLATVGASQALLHVEDVRALKETKNRIRRLVNTEAANVDRAAGAAAAQSASIALLADAYGLRNLTPVLREVAELRLAHPTDTLAELGRRCDPPAKKSTINGRLATLMRLARTLADRPTAGDASRPVE